MVGAIRVLLCDVRFGAYETFAELGHGGMADLYLARRSEHGAGGPIYILKTLRLPLNERRATMFTDEARLGLLLVHPNIVRTIEVGREGARPFMTMEFLEGQPFDRVIKHVRDRDLLVWILAESLRGLHYAHELTTDDGSGGALSIVHRDFTPQNVFITYDGQVKVLDFGIAKAAGRMYRTSTNEVKGKLRYMAPEQALGLRIDRRADVFSAGLILWELFTGGVSIWGPKASEREIFDDLVGASYPTAISDAPTLLNAVLERALARDASERYGTAEAMRSDLAGVIANAADCASRCGSVLTDVFREHRERARRIIANATEKSY